MVFFISFFRNLCLKTVEQFINHEDKCDFKIRTAQNILQDGKFIIKMWLGLHFEFVVITRVLTMFDKNKK